MAKDQLTWNDAIAKVLQDEGLPMNYLDVTEAIIQRQLRSQVGATPSYTVAAQFTQDIQKGERARFVRVSKGVYGLKEWEVSSPLPITIPDLLPVEIDPESETLAIRAYGMYWERSLVDWARTTPRLLGQQFQNSTAVDHQGQVGLYVLYDLRTIVYAGRATATTIGFRLREHTIDRLRSRWNRFSWFGFRGVREDGSLADVPHNAANLDELIGQLEAMLIELLEPPQNRQQGKGLVGVEYLQNEDPELTARKKKALINELVDRL